MIPGITGRIIAPRSGIGTQLHHSEGGSRPGERFAKTVNVFRLFAVSHGPDKGIDVIDRQLLLSPVTGSKCRQIK